MICNYPDTILLCKTTVDGYGTNTISSSAYVPAVFEQTTGYGHGGYQDVITADAVVFVDPTDDFVEANKNRLEGFMVLANPYNEDADLSWYEVETCAVRRSTLLCNDLEHIELSLRKIQYVS